MKLSAAHKTGWVLAAAIAAVVLCTLPFLAAQKAVISIYSDSPVLGAREEGFVRELKKNGYRVRVNPGAKSSPALAAVWFKPPEAVSGLPADKAVYNFVYNEAYYPFDWRGLRNIPVVLTPYRDLYEHYARANIKSALFSLGINTAEFAFPGAVAKKYPLIWYGDNNKNAPLADEMRARRDIRFLGKFWPRDGKDVPATGDREKGQILAQTAVAVVYSPANTPDTKKIPSGVAEAAAAGALVITTENAAVREVYGDSVIMAQNEKDIPALADYYLAHPEIAAAKIITARSITAQKMSSAAVAARFIEILNWLQDSEN